MGRRRRYWRCGPGRSGSKRRGPLRAFAERFDRVAAASFVLDSGGGGERIPVWVQERLRVQRWDTWVTTLLPDAGPSCRFLGPRGLW